MQTPSNQTPIDQTLLKITETMDAITSGLDIVFVPFTLDQVRGREQRVFGEMFESLAGINGIGEIRADRLDIRAGMFFLRVEVLKRSA